MVPVVGYLTTLPHDKSLNPIVIGNVRHQLTNWQTVLVIVPDPKQAIEELHKDFPNNLMEVVPNCGIRIHREEFGK